MMQTRCQVEQDVFMGDNDGGCCHRVVGGSAHPQWICSPTVGLLTHSAVPLLTHNSAGPGVGGCLLTHSRVTHTYNAVLW